MDWVNKIQRFLAITFGKYVEVDTPTLSYKAYIWKGYYWFV